ncbi:hypothetical protein ACTFIW_001436 [Dictyostelium discoideum]
MEKVLVSISTLNKFNSSTINVEDSNSNIKTKNDFKIHKTYNKIFQPQHYQQLQLLQPTTLIISTRTPTPLIIGHTRGAHNVKNFKDIPVLASNLPKYTNDIQVFPEIKDTIKFLKEIMGIQINEGYMEALLDAFTCVVENKANHHYHSEKEFQQRTCNKVEAKFHSTKLQELRIQNNSLNQNCIDIHNKPNGTFNTIYLRINPYLYDEEIRKKSDKQSIIHFNSLFSSCKTPQILERRMSIANSMIAEYSERYLSHLSISKREKISKKLLQSFPLTLHFSNIL